MRNLLRRIIKHVADYLRFISEDIPTCRVCFRRGHDHRVCEHRFFAACAVCSDVVRLNIRGCCIYCLRDEVTPATKSFAYLQLHRRLRLARRNAPRAIAQADLRQQMRKVERATKERVS